MRFLGVAVSVTPFLMHKIPILAEMIKMYKTDYVYPLDNGYYVKITEIYKGEIYPSIQALEGEDFKQLCERENYYQIPKSNVCIYGDKLFMVFSDILYEIDQAKHFIGIRRFNIENVQFLDKGIVAKTMSGETIQEFTSRKDAVKWLQDNNFTKSDNRDNIIATIGRVANGQRKSAYGMKWENLS